MLVLPVATSIEELRADVLRVPLSPVKDGSGHAGDQHKPGWIHGLSMARIQHDLQNYPGINSAVRELQTYLGRALLMQVMVNKLDSYAKLGKHTDGPPSYSRWHLPVFTNDMVEWWDEREGRCYMYLGRWHGPVNYCGVLHSMTNAGWSCRYHVVADFDVLG